MMIVAASWVLDHFDRDYLVINIFLIGWLEEFYGSFYPT